VSQLAKREENGIKGEARTHAILVDQYWVWKPKPDVDGADYLLQLPSNSLEELRAKNNTLQVFGIVQAKFFEGTNQVDILRRYVEDEHGEPRPEFFVMLHTDDEKGDNVVFVFGAAEIQEQFFLNKNKSHYCFSLKADRTYESNRNLSKQDIFSRITSGIRSAEAERQEQFISDQFFGRPTVTQT
jgi:hypothetical protein